MVSTPEGFTDSNPIPHGPSVPVKQPNTSKSICQLSEILNVKPKTYVRRLCAPKSKRKETRSESMVWYSITNRLGHTKVNKRVNKALYNWILQLPQVVQSPIDNDYVRLSIDGQS